jgi:acetyl-CoA C-acetyltransferase
MESIKDKVAIVGMGCTKFGELWDRGPYDLMVDACYEAFEDAGIESKDIQAAWFATLFTGFTGARLATALKLEYIPISRVENYCSGGLTALANACYAVASGAYDIVLVCGVEKLKDAQNSAGWSSNEPFCSSKAVLNIPPPNMFDQLALRNFYRRGWDLEKGKRILAQIAVKNHHNGTLNSKAHLRREITVEQVLQAPMIVSPYGLYDCCGVSDGAAAAIVVRSDMAKSFNKDYVLIKGVGFSSGAGQPLLQDDDDFIHIRENIVAARLAYEQAGIKNPRKEIDLAEVHDCFTFHELLLYEELGFSPEWKAPEDIEAGTFTLGGELPVNTDGGLKCFGHPISASGLRMTYEIYKQFQDKAGSRQVKNARLGVAHNCGGFMGYFNAGVVVCGRSG